MWVANEKRYGSRVVEAAQGRKGYNDRRLLRRVAKPDEGLSISLWETTVELESDVRGNQGQELASPERFKSAENCVKRFEVRYRR